MVSHQWRYLSQLSLVCYITTPSAPGIDTDLLRRVKEGLFCSNAQEKSTMASSISTHTTRKLSALLVLGILGVFGIYHVGSLRVRYRFEKGAVSSSRTPLNPGKMANWTERHATRRIENSKRMEELINLLPHFVASDEILSFHELEVQWTPILQDQGIVLFGDSTSRLLYNKLWCLMEGIFREENRERECSKAGKESLKATGQACTLTNSEKCIFQAALTNKSAPAIKLYYGAHYSLNPLPVKTRELIQPLARFVFFGMPCLHSLWSPGSREKYVYTEYPKWSRNFDDFYNSIEPLASLNGMDVLLGTPVTVCEEKFEAESELIRAYLAEERFGDDPNKAKHQIEYYNYGFKKSIKGALPHDYRGPIPVLRDFRANHSADNALFDQGGVLECTVTGLTALHQRHGVLNGNFVVADLQGATSNGCNGTDDGRHYILGVPLRRQLTLLLRAVQHAHSL